MLKRPLVVVSGMTVLGVLCGGVPALADDIYGNVNCDQNPSPACDLDVGKGGGSATPDRGSGNGNVVPKRPGSGHSDDGGGKDSGSGDTIVGDKSNLAECSYVKSDYEPPTGGAIPASYSPVMEQHDAALPVVFVSSDADVWQAQADRSQAGSWYVWMCSRAGVADALYRPPVWIPEGQEPEAAQLPSPEELAQMAHQQLRLPEPSIAASPSGDQLVNLPTWLWLSDGWGPVSATASVPGVSVTATATPISVTWSTGDGATVTCTGAGTPFDPGSDPRAPSPDCGHTYRSSSASQPGQAFPVTATVHWTVSWSGAGRSGTFPEMTTTSTTAFRVAESQALNNGGG
jgi:hypothetical protein